jgi:hypothetical protein
VIVSIIGIENVALSVSDVPLGSSVEFDPPSGIKSFGSTMTVATSPTTPTGTYVLTITGVDGRGKVRTASYELRIVGPYERAVGISLSIVTLVLAVAIAWLLMRRRRTRRESRRVLRSVGS